MKKCFFLKEKKPCALSLSLVSIPEKGKIILLVDTFYWALLWFTFTLHLHNNIPLVSLQISSFSSLSVFFFRSSLQNQSYPFGFKTSFSAKEVCSKIIKTLNSNSSLHSICWIYFWIKTLNLMEWNRIEPKGLYDKSTAAFIYNHKLGYLGESKWVSFKFLLDTDVRLLRLIRRKIWKRRVTLVAPLQRGLGIENNNAPPLRRLLLMMGTQALSLLMIKTSTNLSWSGHIRQYGWLVGSSWLSTWAISISLPWCLSSRSLWPKSSLISSGKRLRKNVSLESNTSIGKERKKKDYWLRRCIMFLNSSSCWHFFFTAMLFVYGRILSQRLANTVTADQFLYRLVSGLIKYHMAICYLLYIIGFMWFILTLKKKMYKYQFGQYAWTHMILIVVFTQSSFTVANIFEGIFWYVFNNFSI